MTIADLRCDADRGINMVDRDEIHIICDKALREEVFVSSKDNLIFLDVDIHDIHRLFQCQSKSLALSDRVADDSLVAS